MDKMEDLRYLSNIVEEALNKMAIDAAFFCSFAIPDLCSQIESDVKGKNGNKDKYIDWYNENVYIFENPPKVNGTNQEDELNQVDGSVIYLLRCKLFHEGSLYHEEVQEKLREKYFKIIHNSIKTNPFYNKYEEILKSDITIEYNFIENSKVSKVGYTILSSGNQNLTAKVEICINKIEFSNKLVLIAKNILKNN